MLRPLGPRSAHTPHGHGRVLFVCRGRGPDRLFVCLRRDTRHRTRTRERRRRDPHTDNFTESLCVRAVPTRLKCVATTYTGP